MFGGKGFIPKTVTIYMIQNLSIGDWCSYSALLDRGKRSYLLAVGNPRYKNKELKYIRQSFHIMSWV